MSRARFGAALACFLLAAATACAGLVLMTGGTDVKTVTILAFAGCLFLIVAIALTVTT